MLGNRGNLKEMLGTLNSSLNYRFVAEHWEFAILNSTGNVMVTLTGFPEELY